ncbi:unnamed protein product [Vicia faba]|uniref:Uncharacterized protein n=1 Tax=Vicia faba TaxID=3906 RepID=A0AAV1AKZ0_VICFA|nr:unnamed protein product [Vicia faba]
MLIPFSIAGKLFAFHRPYPTEENHPQKVNQFLPCFSSTAPLALTLAKPISARFMVSGAHIFCSIPPAKHCNILYLARQGPGTKTNSMGAYQGGLIRSNLTSSCPRSSFRKVRPTPSNSHVGC